MSLIRLSFNTMSLVARASCTGDGVAGHCWRPIDQAGCFRADMRVKVCNAPGKRVNVVRTGRASRASCGCPTTAMLAPPFCRGSKGESRMRTAPSRNPLLKTSQLPTVLHGTSACGKVFKVYLNMIQNASVCRSDENFQCIH